MKKTIQEIIGWLGAIMIVLAYFLISFNYIAADNITYQTLNFLGASAIVYISLIKKAFQPAFINAIWAIVAIIILIKLIF